MKKENKKVLKQSWQLVIASVTVFGIAPIIVISWIKLLVWLWNLIM